MDPALGFTFGAAATFQPPDLLKRKDTPPPPHPNGKPSNRKPFTTFNRNHINTWPVEVSELQDTDLIAEESEELVSDLLQSLEDSIGADASSHRSSRNLSMRFLLLHPPRHSGLSLTRLHLNTTSSKAFTSDSIIHL